MNTGLMEIDVEGREFPALQLPVFLLIQCNRILDCKDSPVTLSYSFANKQADIFVACGIVNEFGAREICAIIGLYRYVPFADKWILRAEAPSIRWRIAVPINSYPGRVLRDALLQLKQAGQLSDPANMGRVTLEGSRSWWREGQ